MADLRKYTRKQMQTYLDALREGATLKAAAAAAGISASGIRERIDRDPRFRHAVNMAKGKAQHAVEKALHRAAVVPDHHGRIDTRAAEMWLTNQDPENWRKRREDLPAEGTDSDVRRRAKEMSTEDRASAQKDAHEAILGSESPATPADPSKVH